MIRKIIIPLIGFNLIVSIILCVIYFNNHNTEVKVTDAIYQSTDVNQSTDRPSNNLIAQVEPEPTLFKDNISKSNAKILELWDESSDPNKNEQLVVQTAKDFVEANYNVDYRDMNGFRNKLLYYFSSSSNAEEWVSNRMDEISGNKVVSQAHFLTDESLLYMDSASEIRVRGRLYIKYDGETDSDYLGIMNLKGDVWYFRNLDILLTIGVDNNEWERGPWTYLGCEYFSEYLVYKKAD